MAIGNRKCCSVGSSFHLLNGTKRNVWIWNHQPCMISSWRIILRPSSHFFTHARCLSQLAELVGEDCHPSQDGSCHYETPFPCDGRDIAETCVTISAFGVLVHWENDENLNPMEWGSQRWVPAMTRVPDLFFAPKSTQGILKVFVMEERLHNLIYISIEVKLGWKVVLVCSRMSMFSPCVFFLITKRLLAQHMHKMVPWCTFQRLFWLENRFC